MDYDFGDSSEHLIKSVFNQLMADFPVKAHAALQRLYEQGIDENKCLPKEFADDVLKISKSKIQT